MDINEETLAFYVAIGHAITAWSGVEDSLLQVMLTCFAYQDGEKHASTFHSIENFRSRLQAIDKLVQIHTSDPDLMAEWAKLVQKTTNLSRKRNQIVHRRVMISGENPPGRRVMLLPMDWRKVGTPIHKSKAALCVIDIETQSQEFWFLMLHLANFRARLAGEEEPAPKSVEQPPRRQTLDALRFQIYALARHPPKPFGG